MRSQVITITPDLAKQYLALNSKNRHLNENHVKYFISQLQNGEWALTHQGIAFSENGRLLDGQHRLTAIERAGVTVEVLVTFGMSEETFSVLDTGHRRTAGDVLSISNIAHPKITAAAIRSFILCTFTSESVWHGKYGSTTSNSAIQAAYCENPDGWGWAAKLAQTNKNHFIISSQLTCLYFMAHYEQGYSKQLLQYFHEKLSHGSYLPQGDPILAYRNKVGSAIYHARRSQQTLANYIKLFNYFVCGQKLKIFKDQQFPPMPKIVYSADSCADSIFLT